MRRARRARIWGVNVCVHRHIVPHRRQLLNSLQTRRDYLKADLLFAGAPSRALTNLDAVSSEGEKRDPNWFLVPANYRAATEAALEAQARAFTKVGTPTPVSYTHLTLPTILRV